MNKVISILFRYLIAAILAFNSLFIFYFIFTPLTIYPVYFLLSLFYPAVLLGDSIIVSSLTIILVEACIAGSAYYLLTILNLTTPMPIKTRIKSLLFSYISFLIINILRISLVSLLFLSSSPYFDFTHKLFWYFLSTIFVVLIWILSIKIFNIKSIPVYTDLNLLKQLKKPKNSKKH